jgi:uncharacterized protein YndB with AHSA1/START domain
MPLRGSVTDHVAARAPEVFALVTDVERLPEWNRVITKVVERPAALRPDAEWVVELRSMGSSWQSRSRVLALDPGAQHFSYRSQTDDGNPSYGDWSWTIAEADDGTRVTISWELWPKTFWRRALLARVRNRQLRREVRASLRALERCAPKGGDSP